jgi:hypothetical protein
MVIVDDIVVPIEVGSVKLTRKECLADRLSKAALHRDGVERWSEGVLEAVELLQNVFKPDETVLGGGKRKICRSPSFKLPLCGQPIRLCRCAAIVGRLRLLRQRLCKLMANPPQSPD